MVRFTYIYDEERPGIAHYLVYRGESLVFFFSFEGIDDFTTKADEIARDLRKANLVLTIEEVVDLCLEGAVRET